MTAVALLLAGGAGTRLHGSENKVYLPVAERPLILWSLEALEASPLVDEIVLVIRADDRDRVRGLLEQHPMPKVGHVVEGGATRHASERAGLDVLASRIDEGSIDLVVVHDGARPFVRQELLTRVIETARETGGALPALPLDAPVLVRAGTGGADQTVVPTNDLRRVQTPQAFRADALLAAHHAAARVGFAGADTSEAVERFGGFAVGVVAGDPDNIKVTFVQDLFAVEELASRWADER